MLQKRFMLVIGLVVAFSMVLSALRSRHNNCHPTARPGQHVCTSRDGSPHQASSADNTPWRLAG